MIGSSQRYLALFFLFAGLCGIATQANGQCIPDPLTVGNVRGRVYFETDKGKQPLEGVSVQLSRYGYKRPALAKVVTDRAGSFDIPAVARGVYSLAISHPAVIGITVEIHVKKMRTNRSEIEAVLRNDSSRECGGATVKVINGQSTH